MKRHRILFRYCLSDLCLFRLYFDAAEEPVPFNPMADPVRVPVEPPPIPDGADLVMRSGVLIPEKLPALQRLSTGICYTLNQTSNFYIDLNSTFEEYLNGFSSKTRSTLQRKVRKIAATAECREFRTPEEAVEFHRLAREVAVKTYQEKLFDGAIPATAEFVERIKRLAELDCFRGYILLHEGKPVSYLYLPVQDGVLIYGYLGYDPEFSNLSVGTVLFYQALEKVFGERKFRYFDFTYGEGQHKTLFGRASFLRADLHFFRWSVRNALGVYGHYFMEWFSVTAGKIMDSMGLKQKIRKLLRGT